MKNMIFVGGIQNSGKSNFCNRLGSASKGIVHIEFDYSYDYLDKHFYELQKIVDIKKPEEII